MLPLSCHTNFVPEIPMDFDTIDTDIWNEIQDAPGEIFDVIPELRQEKFDFDAYINADYDF